MLRSSTLALVLLLAFARLGIVGAGAQTATPAAREAGEGVGDASARELLLQAALRRLPEPPAVVRLRRLTLRPDAVQGTTTPPGLEFAVVETGTAVVTVGGAAVFLPGEGERQSLAAGAEVALRAGDRLAFPLDTPHAFRNDGAAEAALLIASVLSADEAGAEAADADGVTTELLGEGSAADLPAGEAAVTLERFRLTAGAGVPAYPGPVLLAVEEGGFASTLAGGDVQLARGGAPGERPVGGSDEVFPVRPGDALFFPRGMEATPPLEGGGRLVLLRLGIRSIETADADGEAVFPVGAAVVVARSDVRLRDAPSTDGAVLAGLAAGQPLVVTGPPEEGNGLLWYPVEAPDDPTLTGYVAAEFLAAG